MSNQLSRRQFVQKSVFTSAAMAGVGYWSSLAPAESKSPNEKLNIAIVGVGGKGKVDAEHLNDQNIMALCDVDEKMHAKVRDAYPKASFYKDYRQMLDKEKSIDGVVVATPDHTHALISLMTMRMGKHCYCQKPLTHSIEEARLMQQVAREMNVATQMGNQGTGHSGFRRGVNLVRSGVIGQVSEVHVWTDRPGLPRHPWWPQGIDRPKDTPPVPKTLAWDLWLGPAPLRPYNPAYHPFTWRGFWDFGTGALGDMGCHTMNLAFMALDLSNPTSVEAETSGTTSESPAKESTVTWHFPKRGKMDPVKVVWYDGGRKPPTGFVPGVGRYPGCGSLLIGSQGTLYSPEPYCGEWTILPEEKFRHAKPKTLYVEEPEDDRKWHYKEWVRACKGGKPAVANFDYAVPLTEMILLGHLACRAGKKIEWDPAAMQVTNAPEANQFVKLESRKGWSIH